MNWGRMEEAPENSKELLHSAHVNGMKYSTQFFDWTHNTSTRKWITVPH
jgi:hypothetical protein